MMMIRRYTGSEVAEVGDADSSAVDTAFASVSARVLRTAPAAWLRHTSAAPSPIFAWVVRAHRQHAQRAGVAGSVTAATDSPNVGAETHQEAAAPPASAEREGRSVGNNDNTTTTTIAAALVRRGVARRDPLLDRIAKRQRAAETSSSGSVRAEGGGSYSHAASAVQRGSDATPARNDLPLEHWTRRPLSAMTPAAWAAFREQLGIVVEPVNWGGDGGRASAPATGSVERRRPLSMYTVDMVRPLRCWEEAALPYALGRCVAAMYSLPTAIQSQCVPLASLVVHAAAAAPATKVDVVGVAETGSGKTMAYLVPILADVRLRCTPNYMSDEELKSGGPLAIVLVPTRELAEQVSREANALLGWPADGYYASAAAHPGGGPHRMSSSTNASGDGLGASPCADRSAWRRQLEQWEAEELAGQPDAHRAQHNLLSEVIVVRLVGGEDEQVQYQQLARGAHLVVGTVGQVHALLDRRLFSLANTKLVVIDEADRMIAENQQADLIAVLSRAPLPRQTLLFTATLSPACEDIARRFLSPDGYVLVRTPYRCASIRQNLEMVSIAGAGAPRSISTATTATRASAANAVGTTAPSPDEGAGSGGAGRRPRSPLIHADKFARLVAWLAYGTPPMVVFAGERRTCDALQEELRAEREYLLASEEHTSVETMVGPAPAGLLFYDDMDEDSDAVHGAMGESSGDAPPPTRALAVAERRAARRRAAESAAQARARIQLDNLSSVAVVHAELSQGERRRLVSQFRDGQRRVLITTDLLARGLDVAGVTLVVNYDLPWPARGGGAGPAEAVVQYIHRIGRTGRAGATGVAVSLIALPATLAQRGRRVEPWRGADGGKVYAPGTAEAVKQRDREWARLTRTEPAVELPVDDEDVHRADDYVDVEGEEEEEGLRRPRRGPRLEGTEDGTSAGTAHTVATDEPLLKPLWQFLCRCVEANGGGLTSAEEAARLLLRGLYAKIDVEPALAAIMAEHAAQGSRHGVIRL